MARIRVKHGFISGQIGLLLRGWQGDLLQPVQFQREKHQEVVVKFVDSSPCASDMTWHGRKSVVIW